MKAFIFQIIVLTAIIFTSCEDVIQVELRNENQDLFVVDAKITSNENPYCYLYKAMPITTDQNIEGISGAVVTISDDEFPMNTIYLQENGLIEGLYSVPDGMVAFGKAGRNYTLTIKVDGVTIAATDFLAPVVPIDSIQVHPSQRGEQRFLAVYTFGKETAGIGNYYKWDIYVNDSLLSGVETMAFASDEMVDGNYISGLEVFTDFHNPMDEEERILKFNDTVYVVQSSISSIVYDYYTQMLNQSGTGFLFSVPPANIKGNLRSSDGKTVLGLFSAQDASVSNKIVIDSKIEALIRKD